MPRGSGLMPGEPLAQRSLRCRDCRANAHGGRNPAGRAPRPLLCPPCKRRRMKAGTRSVAGCVFRRSASLLLFGEVLAILPSLGRRAPREGENLPWAEAKRTCRRRNGRRGTMPPARSSPENIATCSRSGARADISRAAAPGDAEGIRASAWGVAGIAFPTTPALPRPQTRVCLQLDRPVFRL